MSRMAYIELSDGKGTAFVFDLDNWHLLQELDFSLETGLEGLTEGEELEYVISVPISKLGIRALDLPMDDLDRVREVLPFELEGLILADPATVTHDAVFLTDTGETRRVLAVNMEDKALSELLSGLKTLHIDPKCITSSELGELAAQVRSGGSLAELISAGVKPDEATARARARSEAETPTVNFRRDRFSYTRDIETVKRHAIKALGLLAAVFLLLLIHFWLNASIVERKARALEDQSLTLYSSLFPDQEARSSKGLGFKAKAGISELEKEAELYRGADALGLMMKLQEHKIEGLTISDITVDLATVTLRGTAKGLEPVHSLKGALEGFLYEVKLTESGVDAKGGTGFTITARKDAP